MTITPDHAPLAGGAKIEITGQGFLRDGAPPNHVVFGSWEAPIASATDDGTLEIVSPAADTAGDVPVTIVNRNGTTTVMGMFHFSAPPTVTSLSPTDVPFNSVSTTVTATGAGFKVDDAGTNVVTVNGLSASSVTATSDTQLTFIVPPGTVLDRPSVSITNANGTVTKDQAFRYIPSMNPALMMFTKNTNSAYVVFYDPMGDTTAIVPQKLANTLGFRTIVQDASGTFWAVQRDNKWGKVDIEKQELVGGAALPSATPRINSLARIGNTIYATANGGQFGTFNLQTGTFTQIVATGFGPCGSALVSDGTNLYFSNLAGCSGTVQPTISTVNPTTGAKGTAVNIGITGSQIDEMRFIGTTLYGISSGYRFPAQVLQIDPTSGTTTVLKVLTFSGSALEVFQPSTQSTIP